MPTQLVNKLTVAAVRKAQPKDKPYTLFDGKGLHVLVAVSGSKTWRLQITFEGVRRPMSIGVYPAMTLENARTKAEHLRALAARGIDPRPARHTPMAELKEATGATPFDQLAKDYWKGRAGLKSGYSETVLSALESYAFPFLAGIPVDTIDRRLALRPLEILHKQGKMEYLKKVRGWTSQVFEYAIEIGEATNNPLGGLNIKRTFGTAKKKPQPHVPQTEVGELWSRLAMEPDDDYGVIGAKLLALTWVRTSELRFMTWSQLGSDGIWRLGDEDMKGELPHEVVLPTQAKKLFEFLWERTRPGQRFVFPHRLHWRDKCISENTINDVFGRIGYRNRHCGHGWRHVASTWANEHDYSPDWSEMQLAHKDKNRIRGSYNYAKYRKQRAKMLQDYADWLDKQSREHEAKRKTQTKVGKAAAGTAERRQLFD